MSKMVVVPSGQANSGPGAIFRSFMQGLGFQADPECAPSAGLKLVSSDYLGLGSGGCAGLAIGIVVGYEGTKLVREFLK